MRSIAIAARLQRSTPGAVTGFLHRPSDQLTDFRLADGIVFGGCEGRVGAMTDDGHHCEREHHQGNVAMPHST